MAGHEAHWDVRRHRLPSGREVEIVCWSDRQQPGGPAIREAGPAAMRCPACGSKRTQPTTGEAIDPRHWRLELRCADCECVWADVFTDPDVEAISEALEEGAEALRRDLAALERANMAEEIERFAAALHAGAIQPMDF